MRENEIAVKLKHQKSNGIKEAKQRYLERSKIVKQQLQMTKECKTGTSRKENLIQQLLDALLRTIE